MFRTVVTSSRSTTKYGIVIGPTAQALTKLCDASPPPHPLRLFNLQNEKKKSPHLFSSLWLHLCGLGHDNIKCDFSVT